MGKISRRSFLLMTGGAGAALATDPSRKFVNKLIPHVTPPQETTPGTWSTYATTCRECPAGCGMYLLHRDGRVTKTEGNPLHPINRGGLCPRGQSAVQGLYDPDRLRHVLRRDKNGLRKSSWQEAIAEIGGRLRDSQVAAISDLQTGSLAEVMSAFSIAFRGKLLLYESFNHEAQRRAHETLFGINGFPRYRLDDCDLIVSFAADFLETWGSPVEYADRFSRNRSLDDGAGAMIYVGPQLTMTAANADRFLMVPPGSERYVALGIIQVLLKRRITNGGKDIARRIVGSAGKVDIPALTGISSDMLHELAEMFANARRPVALGGSHLGAVPADVDTAIFAALLNHLAGAGDSVDFSSRHAFSRTAAADEISALLQSITPRHLVIIHNANLAFTFPDSIEHLRRAGLVVYLGNLPDETAELAHWVLPLDSPLETWGDYDPYDGIHCLVQPGMTRLYNTRNAGDILLELARGAGRPLVRRGKSLSNFEEWLRSRWNELQDTFSHRRPMPSEIFWREALRSGGIWAEPPATAPPLSPSAAAHVMAPPPAADPQKLHLVVTPSILLYDGRVANRGWLQEAPHPITTIAWGAWVDIHPQTAERLHLRQGDVAEVKNGRDAIFLPVRVTPEVAPETAAVILGQGHAAKGLKTAAGIGANVFLLDIGHAGEANGSSVSIRKTARRERLVNLSATTDQHHRHMLQWIPFSKIRRMELDQAEELHLPLPEGYLPERDLYPPHRHERHRWAMVVDLQRCIGCSACTIACYAENNVPVVGKELAAKGREMAWLKVVPYRKEDEALRIGWLPMLCQHCDAAPCEPVCPVYAAVHNEEGLNAQVYNRCIGTRYCSNNCPYKVRRFNWFDFGWKPPLNWQLNPEVTVRSRGVMEKCTFCVQRIRNAEYQARREKRRLKDGEVQPACVQSCPARVYTFGDLLDPEAKVTKIIRSDRRRYQVLQELNTKPAVVYLKRVIMDETV